MPAVEKGLIYTEPYGPPPLKIKKLKSDFLHTREDQKIGQEPTFHAPRPSNGKDYSGQPKRGHLYTKSNVHTVMCVMSARLADIYKIDSESISGKAQ